MKAVNIFLLTATASLLTGSLGLNLVTKRDAEYVEGDDPSTLTGEMEARDSPAVGSSGNDETVVLSTRARNHGYDIIGATTGRPTRKPKKDTKKPETSTKVNDASANKPLPESQNPIVNAAEPDDDDSDSNENALHVGSGKNNTTSSSESLAETEETTTTTESITTLEPTTEIQTTTTTTERATTVEPTTEILTTTTTTELPTTVEPTTEMQTTTTTTERVTTVEPVTEIQTTTTTTERATTAEPLKEAEPSQSNENVQDGNGNLANTNDQEGSDQPDEDGGDSESDSNEDDEGATVVNENVAQGKKDKPKRISNYEQNSNQFTYYTNPNQYGYHGNAGAGGYQYEYPNHPQHSNQGDGAADTAGTGDGKFAKGGKKGGKKRDKKKHHDGIHGDNSGKKEFDHNSQGKKDRRGNKTRVDGGGTDKPKRVSNYEQSSQQFTWYTNPNQYGYHSNGYSGNEYQNSNQGAAAPAESDDYKTGNAGRFDKGTSSAQKGDRQKNSQSAQPERPISGGTEKPKRISNYEQSSQQFTWYTNPNHYGYHSNGYGGNEQLYSNQGAAAPAETDDYKTGSSGKFDKGSSSVQNGDSQIYSQSPPPQPGRPVSGGTNKPKRISNYEQSNQQYTYYTNPNHYGYHSNGYGGNENLYSNQGAAPTGTDDYKTGNTGKFDKGSSSVQQDDRQKYSQSPQQSVQSEKPVSGGDKPKRVSNYEQQTKFTYYTNPNRYGY